MDLKLKPCPFCGNEDIRVEVLRARNDILAKISYVKAEIRCDNCKVIKGVIVTGRNYDICKIKIQEDWNKRSNV